MIDAIACVQLQQTMQICSLADNLTHLQLRTSSAILVSYIIAPDERSHAIKHYTLAAEVLCQYYKYSTSCSSTPMLLVPGHVGAVPVLIACVPAVILLLPALILPVPLGPFQLLIPLVQRHWHTHHLCIGWLCCMSAQCTSLLSICSWICIALAY